MDRASAACPGSQLDEGRTLFGLSQSLLARNKPGLAEVEMRFRKVWAKADVEIPSSCVCQVLARVETQSNGEKSAHPATRESQK
jgi:hypothetical protein